MNYLEPRDRQLYHQIHPLKFLADGTAELISLPLFWRHHLGRGLVAHFVPPILASFALIRWANLEPYQRSPFGRYVARWMSPRMQALRLIGDLVMVVGAWRRQWMVILAGALLVLFGWLRGKWPRAW